MSLADEMQTDYSAIRMELPAHVDIGGARLAALVSNGSFSETLELGGFAAQRSLTVKLLASELPARPQAGALLYYHGTAYRIASINAREGIPFLTLECLQQ